MTADVTLRGRAVKVAADALRRLDQVAQQELLDADAEAVVAALQAEGLLAEPGPVGSAQ